MLHCIHLLFVISFKFDLFISYSSQDYGEELRSSSRHRCTRYGCVEGDCRGAGLPATETVEVGQRECLERCGSEENMEEYHTPSHTRTVCGKGEISLLPLYILGISLHGSRI